MAMTFLEEFEQQWASLCNYLESEMIKSNQQSGTVDLQNIERLLDNEKKRWKLPGQYNYAWLEKLRSMKPNVASEFENALADVRLEQIQTSGQPSSILIVGSAAGGAVAGFIAAKLLEAAALMSVVGTAGLGAIGAAVGTGIYNNKRREAENKNCEAYVGQLKLDGKRLGNIVERADKA